MRLLSKIIQRGRTFANARDGSEATEMVVTTAMLIMLLMSAIMMLSYVIEYNNVTHATKLVVRNIETTGLAPASGMSDMFNRALGNNRTNITNRSIGISNVTYHNAGNRSIQLKNTFRVTGSVNYIIPLINPGSFSGIKITLPIKVTVTGMSEVYWPKTP